MGDDELQALRELARSYLGFSEETIDELVAAGKVMEVGNGESETS